MSYVRRKWLGASGEEQSQAWQLKFQRELDDFRQQHHTYAVSAEIESSQLAEAIGSPRAEAVVAKYGFCLVPELERSVPGDILRCVKRSVFLNPQGRLGACACCQRSDGSRVQKTEAQAYCVYIYIYIYIF